ncbi:hypothetical protein OKW43_000791 [Paraburkholderia sp. WC7.3g]
MPAGTRQASIAGEDVPATNRVTLDHDSIGARTARFASRDVTIC